MKTPSLVLALWLAVVASACAHRDAWKHATLAGPQADRQFDVDDRVCEDSVPAALPSAVYADHNNLAIYESHNGSTRAGDTAGATAQRYQALTSAPSAASAGNAAQAKTAAGRVEYGVNQSAYDRCMAGKGWSRSTPGDEARDPAM